MSPPARDGYSFHSAHYHRLTRRARAHPARVPRLWARRPRRVRVDGSRPKPALEARAFSCTADLYYGAVALLMPRMTVRLFPVHIVRFAQLA